MGHAQPPPAPDDGQGDDPKEKGLPEVGEVLGTYRVLGRVGSGGMAVIYRAEHVRLRREVALKVLRPALAARPASLKRFIEEARAVNEIGHPNIVDVIDIIEDHDGETPLVYMVMELLFGEDLHTRIAREGALSVRDTIEIASQIADALTATHAENILHRDLKPSNVFLAQSDGQAIVKLLDFGLLKHFGDRPARHLTRPEVVPGTPLYMSPEQVMGGVLDQRTDVYGFGLVVYEMLAAVPPFAGKQDTEVLVLHAKEPAPALTDHRPELDPKLVAAAMRCLEKSPDARYPTVAAARDALVQAANLAPQPPVPSSLSDEAMMASLRAPSQRRRWRFVFGLALAGLVLGGALWWWVATRQVPADAKRGRPIPSATAGADQVAQRPPASGASVARGGRGAPAHVADASSEPSAAGAGSDASRNDALSVAPAAVKRDAAAARLPAVAPPSRRPRARRAGRRPVRLRGRRGGSAAGRQRPSGATPPQKKGGNRALEAVTVDPWSH